MLIRKIKGHTAVIGKEQGYLSLPIRVEDCAVETAKGIWNTFRVLTAWEPTPKELERINAGESIIVSLINALPFPPIELTVDTSDSVAGVDEYTAAMEDVIDSIERLVSAIEVKATANNDMKLLLRIELFEGLLNTLKQELAKS